MLLTIPVILMHEVYDNACDLVVGLRCLCGVMGLHIHIALVDLVWGYE